MSNAELYGGRIAVVGSGAVGCYYGGRLAAAGEEVRFLMRSDLEAVRERGMRVRSVDGDFELDDVWCAGSGEAIGPVDLVVIALKTTANGVLDAVIPPLLKEGTVLLTLQNGLGNDTYLAERFGAERVMGALCFVCINRTGPGEIEHYAQGAISLGEYGRPAGERARAIGEAFVSSGVRCTVVEDLAREQWKKLVWNVPFNGLSIAAGGIDTEAILADPSLEAEVRAVMAEVVAAAAAQGHVLPDGLMGDMVERTRGMGAYKPSSLIDYLDGREVEVEAIWGEAVRRAEAAGAPMERTEALYEQIKHAVAKRRGVG